MYIDFLDRLRFSPATRRRRKVPLRPETRACGRYQAPACSPGSLRAAPNFVGRSRSDIRGVPIQLRHRRICGRNGGDGHFHQANRIGRLGRVSTATQGAQIIVVRARQWGEICVRKGAVVVDRIYRNKGHGWRRTSEDDVGIKIHSRVQRSAP